MSLILTLALLFAAALLEAGGDALVRSALHATGGMKAILMTAGAIVLFAYGYVVNTPPWDFGRLLGVYVVFFFVVAQLLAWLVFHQKPSGMVLIGGGFIVAGGCIVAAASMN